MPLRLTVQSFVASPAATAPYDLTGSRRAEGRVAGSLLSALEQAMDRSRRSLLTALALRRAERAARAGNRVTLGTATLPLEALLATRGEALRELLECWMGPPRPGTGDSAETGLRHELRVDVYSEGPAALDLLPQLARLDRDHVVRVVVPGDHRGLEAARSLAAETLEVIVEPVAGALAPRTIAAAAAAGVADVRLPADAPLGLRSLRLAHGFPAV